MGRFEPGDSIGHYRILAKLGEGGMGVVYRARDTRLERDVAIKLLAEPEELDPPAVAARVARLEREARLLAQLNHPNVAQVHGLEAGGDGALGVVMELVEGPTLADRLARGPLPARQALGLAVQIAEGLAAAHERGIVHRDLKPANVKLGTDGAAKILDFGIARTLETEPAIPSAESAREAPTLATGATAGGVVAGTASYMSPEQARGEPVDRRTDVWAFGALVYEMLTGRRLFSGPARAETIALVLSAPIDLARLPAETPAELRRLIERCLERSPRDRLHDLADARLVLEDVLAGRLEPAARAFRRGHAAALVAAVAIVAAAAGWLAANRREAAPARAVSFALAPPPGKVFDADGATGGSLAVSPDGSRLAFTARDQAGNLQLWVRELASVEARPLGGTQGAYLPFWSPDATRIGFFAAGKLQVVDLVGGAPVVLAEAPVGKGGAWSARGWIVFAPAANGPLVAVPERGGDPRPVTRLDGERGESSHRHPSFLADGERFLYLARYRPARAPDREEHLVVAGTLDGELARPILRADSAAQTASGRLLFLRDSDLVALPFDERALAVAGEPEVLAQGVLAVSSARGAFSAARRGVLAYQLAGGTRASVLRWRSREGVPLATVGESADHSLVVLSPSGREALVRRKDPETGNRDLWRIDLDGGRASRFTFDPESDHYPVFAPGGGEVAWTTEADGRYTIWRKSLRGLEDARRVAEFDRATAVAGWHGPLGELLLVQRPAGGAEAPDLMRLKLGPTGEAAGEPVAYVATPATENLASLSPDGRWALYASNESGRFELYVAPYPGPGRRWQISSGGASWGRWRGDGREIVYAGTNGIVAVALDAGDGVLETGVARPLFEHESELVGFGWALASEGDRLLVLEHERWNETEPLTVTLGWEERPPAAGR